MEYDPKQIEPRWQKRWEDENSFVAGADTSKPKYYCLIEFPYPSGDGLHVGHIRSNTAMDLVARKRRREGFDVLYPIGWDAFGLPTENYAIKTGIQPAVVTKTNTDNFRRQLKSLGFSFDWSREVNTTDPEYYKWTQWIFLQLLKDGLAYKAKMEINWCPKDKIGLANEEVIDGCCERCGTPVEKREKEQWILAITKYAERLDKDLDDVAYLDKIKAQQRNWIGKSEGAEISFLLDFKKDAKLNENRGPNGERAALSVFTTRPDTIFGATYLVLAPEHPWVKLALDGSHDVVSNKKELSDYVVATRAKTDIERGAIDREKTGIEVRGVMAINPATKEEIPIWIADYVLPHYGTGAVMAVPAHDERDNEFARTYGLPVREVVLPNIIDKRNPPIAGKKVVERNTIHAIVKDPATGKYLALKWKKFDWTTFPMGGREEGETPEMAARREVEEETGFTNLKLVRVLEGRARAEYFAAHKDENRISYTNAVLFELVDHAQKEVSQKEKDDHDTVWLDEAQLTYEHMTHAEVGEWQRQFLSTNGAYTESGILVDSGAFTGRSSEESKKAITESLGGKWVTKYRLRDWIFSRQRYWGEPIPVVHCEKCGIVPVPEKDLPVVLPEVKNYQPTDTGESPLAAIAEWVNTTCPACDGPAKRETDTMPNWAGSSWYYLRYIDPHNKGAFCDREKLNHWSGVSKTIHDPRSTIHTGPVDWYNGGMEHTTLHLLYSRFWHKFLFDKGFVPTSEPYAKRTSHGLILAEGGVKMSKSKGNVINPDSLVDRFGADALRLYEMFMGPFDQSIAWSTDGLVGTRRFLERVWRLADKVSADAKTSLELEVLYNQTIEKVSADIEAFKCNTAVSALMILCGSLEKADAVPINLYHGLLSLLNPFVPHITEQLWGMTSGAGQLSEHSWPVPDTTRKELPEVKVAIQINGKVRDTMTVARGLDQTHVEQVAFDRELVKKWLAGVAPKKVIYIQDKLLSIVVE